MDSKQKKNNPAGPFSVFKHPTFALLILLFASLSCVLDGLTPPPPSSTPSPQTGLDYLRYEVPAYSVTLSPGQSVPGTGVKYVTRLGDDYHLTVDNTPLFTPGNTQVVWEGVIRPSVFARYQIRISPEPLTDNLVALASVSLVILRSTPTELIGIAPETINGAIHFTGILVGETASVGQTVAGTSLRYEGERNGAAAFSGTLQTALRPLGSSFIWYGKMLDNVFVKHTLAVRNVALDSVRLEGPAEIWIIPGR